MSDSDPGKHWWWLGFHTRARAVQRIGVEAVLLCFLGLFAGPSALAHDLYAKFIQHTVRVVAYSDHISLELDLTFFEEESARERKVMDTDRDGRVSRSEQEAYLQKLSASCPRQVALRVAGQELPLAELYAPELELAARTTTEPAHHRLRLFLFAENPTGLKAGDEIVVNDRLWPAVRSLSSLQMEANSGGKLEGKGAAICTEASEAGLSFRLRCLVPPGRPPAGAAGLSLAPAATSQQITKTDPVTCNP